MQSEHLRLAVVVIVVLIVISFGIALVRKNVPAPGGVTASPPEETKPTVKASRSVLPDDMAMVVRRHVEFNPMVEVMQDVDTTAFRPEYRTAGGSTRARKRQAVSSENGGFQESELFNRMTHDASFMAPIASGTQFQQQDLNEESSVGMY